MIVKLCGWIGMICLLISYYLISKGKVKGRSKVYHGLNLVGSVGLTIDAFSGGVWSIVVLNIIWAIIAVKSLLRR